MSKIFSLLNRILGLITKDNIRPGSVASVAALERAIGDFIKKHNANKKPLVCGPSLPPKFRRKRDLQETLS